jgi:hypothetical protein
MLYNFCGEFDLTEGEEERLDKALKVLKRIPARAATKKALAKRKKAKVEKRKRGK